MWTFEMSLGEAAWQRSSKRFETEALAIKAALEFAETCLWNKVSIGVRVIPA